MQKLLVIICAFVATGAAGDTLSDVKAAVGRLSARQPVRATFTTEQLVKSAGRFASGNTTRNVSADVTHDENGLAIVIPQALIEKVSRSRRAGDDSAIHLIGAIRSIAIVEAIDFRDPFLDLLGGAKVSSETRTPFHGRPARRLALKLVAGDSKAKDGGSSIRIGSVKAEDQMTLWVGDDDLPLAAERIAKTTAGFMFLQATFAAKMNYTFSHTADRLILARLETSDAGSGMGQKVEKTAVQTMTLR